jgi:hypothetical protein
MSIHLIHQRANPEVVKAALAERERRRIEDSERARRAADPGLDLRAQQQIFDEEAAGLTARKLRRARDTRVALPLIAAGPLLALAWLLLIEWIAV